MFCRNCGKEILDDDKFCSYCGTKVEEEIVDLSEDTKELPVWSKFANLGYIFSLITIIGGCLSLGLIGVLFGDFAIVFSALGLRAKEKHFESKKALKISIIGFAISLFLFEYFLCLLCIALILMIE